MKRETLTALTTAAAEGRALVLATRLSDGTERLIDPSRPGDGLAQRAAEAAARDASTPFKWDGEDWFLNVFNPALRLIIMGAVHIAQPLNQMAAALGWDVTVIDPRTAFATAERFPGARLVTEWPDEALASVGLTPRTALVALTHDPKLDDPALLAALASDAFYIGALGSRKTHAARTKRLSEAGAQNTHRISGPVGLDIGALTPAEIAVSIVAEIVDVLRHDVRRFGAAKVDVPRPMIDTRPVAGVVLAAGRSTRMGAMKMLADIDGQPMIRRTVETALAGGLSSVIVVTGHEAARVGEALRGLPVTIIRNPDYLDGLSASLKAGIAAVPETNIGALVMLGDMPRVTVSDIKALVAHSDREAIVAPVHNGKRGNPVLWPRRYFAEIAKLSGDSGARSIMASARDAVIEVECGAGVLIDADTEADLAAIRGDMP